MPLVIIEFLVGDFDNGNFRDIKSNPTPKPSTCRFQGITCCTRISHFLWFIRMFTHFSIIFRVFLSISYTTINLGYIHFFFLTKFTIHSTDNSLYTLIILLYQHIVNNKCKFYTILYKLLLSKIYKTWQKIFFTNFI